MLIESVDGDDLKRVVVRLRVRRRSTVVVVVVVEIVVVNVPLVLLLGRSGRVFKGITTYDCKTRCSIIRKYR